MKYILASEQPQTYMLVFDTGDDVLKALTAFAKENQIQSAHLSGIGAFSSAKVGYYDFSIHDYKPIPVNEQAEVLSFLGDITLYQQEPKIHAHVGLGRSDGATVGGHLLQATVKPTLELVLTALPVELNREMDSETRIPLIKL